MSIGTFYYPLPAHPSYFNDQYTPWEIEEALRIMDRFYKGIIFKGRDGGEKRGFAIKFPLLTEPGMSQDIVIEGPDEILNDPRTSRSQLEASRKTHENYITMLKNSLERVKMGLGEWTG